jgi:deoxyribodipyrimidine photolyase-related protein
MTIGLVFPHQCFDPKHIPKHWKSIRFIRHDIAYGGPNTTVSTFHIARKVYFRAIEAAWMDVMHKKRPQVKIEIIDRHKKWYTTDNCECWDPVDKMIETEIKKHCKNTVILDTPSFILTGEQAVNIIKPDDKHAVFYAAIRRQTGILMTDTGKPEGGKWRYDTDNRNPVKKNTVLPNWKKEIDSRQSKYVEAAYNAVKKEKSLGEWTGQLIFPTTHDGAYDALKRFVKQRLEHFGEYQDAIIKDDNPLFHSVLSGPLNSGLLTPQDVIEEALKYKGKVSLSDLEGFIAQVIGWREFMRTVYVQSDGTPPKNRLKHGRHLGQQWYNGTTHLDPVDAAIARANKWGYLHHIERLMVVGNAMFLCDIKPQEVYKWFMELFIDSFDWVMYGNVYYMSQWLSNDITTKPYISSSAYILRMSDYKKGEWSAIWDALYWRQIGEHGDVLRKNYRMAAQVAFWEKKTAADKKLLLTAAAQYLKN